METLTPLEDVELDIEALRAQTEQNCQLMTSARFLATWQDVVMGPNRERCERGKMRLNPDALRASGIDVPEGLRISSRYFERSFEARDEAVYATLAASSPDLRHADLVPETSYATAQRGQLTGEMPMLWACGGFGALSFCGCAGGGKDNVG